MHMSEASEPSALPDAADAGETGEHTQLPPGREPDRRQRHRWVPITAGWLSLLIGLADVVSAVIPRLQLVHRLHRITPFVPGVLTNVTFTADVIIGLLLLMLSHGLRRRKRRAWQATCLLLAFSVLIHVVHAPYLAPGVISAILLGGLLFYRDEFYAVGDARTRWRAARVFVCLLIADVAIGLTYMLLVHGLAQDYSVWQRIVHTVYGLVGVTGPVQFVPESRSDFFNTPDQFARRVHAARHRVPVPAPGQAEGQAQPAGRAGDPGTAGTARAPGLAGLFHAPPRQERDLVSPPASPASGTGWSPGSCWPAVTPSEIPRPGPARSTRSSTRRPGTPGRPR